VSFTSVTLCVASQRVFIVVSVYFHYRPSPETFGYALVYLETGGIFKIIPSNSSDSKELTIFYVLLA
jgi:hypothetical protein